ncbi:MAG: hypothetical protein Kow0032_28770 [Methyloligellaceae bacterium]
MTADLANSEMASAMDALHEQRESAPPPQPEAERPKRPERAERAPEPRAEPRQHPSEDDGTAPRSWSVDDAYQHLQDAKDQQAEPADTAPPVRSEATDTGADLAADGDDSGPLWTNAEVEAVRSLQQRAQAFQQDLAAFAQLKANVNLEALEQQDKGRAQMVRQRLNEIEADLRQSYESIQQDAGGLSQKAMKHRLEKEKARLSQEVPDLDKGALKTYLEGRGFSRQEIEQAADARLVALAEKARRYDEMMANKTRKAPKLRKGAKPRSAKPEPEATAEVIALTDRVQRTGDLDAALQLYYARRGKQPGRRGAR